MGKTEIRATLLKQLEANLNVLIQSANDAKEAATGDEAKAENKYDTRGLEASYLAGAQAKRAEELKFEIHNLKKLELKKFSATDKIQMTALITAMIDGEKKRHFIMLPHAGGLHIEVDKIEVMVITPDSPIGKLMLNKSVDDSFDFPIKDKVANYEITALE